MKATDFEFRWRWSVISGIYSAAFFCYFFDRQNFVVALYYGWLHVHNKNSWTSVRLAFAVATLVAVLAALIRTWATAYLSADVVQDTRLHSSRLVADGPYRYVRNPLYLGNLLLAISYTAMASRLGGCILIAGHLIFLPRLIGREEAELLANQGEPYRNYLNAVPRLIPAWKARVAPGTAKPNWINGFSGEFMMWAFAAALAAFAATLDLQLFFVFLGIAIGGSLGIKWGLARKRRLAGR